MIPLSETKSQPIPNGIEPGITDSNITDREGFELYKQLTAQIKMKHDNSWLFENIVHKNILQNISYYLPEGVLAAHYRDHRETLKNLWPGGTVTPEEIKRLVESEKELERQAIESHNQWQQEQDKIIKAQDELDRLILEEINSKKRITQPPKTLGAMIRQLLNWFI